MSAPSTPSRRGRTPRPPRRPSTGCAVPMHRSPSRMSVGGGAPRTASVARAAFERVADAGVERTRDAGNCEGGRRHREHLRRRVVPLTVGSASALADQRFLRFLDVARTGVAVGDGAPMIRRPSSMTIATGLVRGRRSRQPRLENRRVVAGQNAGDASALAALGGRFGEGAQSRHEVTLATAPDGAGKGKIRKTARRSRCGRVTPFVGAPRAPPAPWHPLVDRSAHTRVDRTMDRAEHSPRERVLDVGPSTR